MVTVNLFGADNSWIPQYTQCEEHTRACRVVVKAFRWLERVLLFARSVEQPTRMTRRQMTTTADSFGRDIAYYIAHDLFPILYYHPPCLIFSGRNYDTF